MFFLLIKLTQMIQHIWIIKIHRTLKYLFTSDRQPLQKMSIEIIVLIINLAGLIYFDLYNVPCSDIILHFTLSFYQAINTRILGY